MKTLEIPHPQWPAFLDRFNRQHDRWLVRLELVDSELGAQVEAEQLPLRGLYAEPATAAAPEQITILLGISPEGVTHSVPQPTHLRLEQTDDGTDSALQIEAKSGPMRLLQFRAPASPETLDGFAP